MSPPIHPQSLRAGQLSLRDSTQSAPDVLSTYVEHLNFLKEVEKQKMDFDVRNELRMQKLCLEQLIRSTLKAPLSRYINAQKSSPIFPPQDYLSFSPSLVLILSLVDFTDLSKCRLVNRRFYDTLKGNRRAMPRQTAGIIMKMTAERDAISVTLRRKNRKGGPDLENEYTVMERSIAVKLHQSAANEDLLLNKKTNGFEEGLVIVLESLLDRYHCNLSLFSDSSNQDNIPLQWFTAVARLFRRCRARCEHLGLPGRADLAIIPSIIGRDQMNCSSNIVLASPDQSVAVLSSFCQMEFCPPINFDLNTVEQIKQLADELPKLIKGWQDNRYRMLPIHLYDIWNYINWPNAELITYLYELEPRIHLNLRNALELFISRPSDDRVLCIKYEEYEIWMYDMVHKGNKEGLQFEEWY